MPKNLIIRGFAACAGVLLAGCFSTQAVYPDTWPRQVAREGHDCPVIDGTYRNAGEAYVGNYDGKYFRQKRSLAHILNGGTGRPSLELSNRLGNTSADPAADPFESITLELGGDRLHVAAAGADGKGRSASLPVEARCRDSLLVLDLDWGHYYQMPGIYDSVGRITLAFGRAEDGSLLVREKEAGTYIFLITPVFTYREEGWSRFEEAPTAVVAASSP